MRVLTLRLAATSALALRPVLREVAACPTPSLVGLRARHWRMEHGMVRGRYLFEDRSSLDAFARHPMCDPAFAHLTSRISDAPVEVGSVEELPPNDILDRPVFVISAPRAGSTLLYELLAHAAEVWTIDGESQGVIEGIPSLHVASRGFTSHRLVDLDAESETVRILRGGFVAELRDHRGSRFLELPVDRRPATVRLVEKT